jgi:hypothetical protein
MALLDEILSLKGLITVSTLFAAHLAIKKISVRGGDKRIRSHTIQGRDINGVRIDSPDIYSGRDTYVYNRDKSVEVRNYKLLWNVLAVLLALGYFFIPPIGRVLSSVLGIFTLSMLVVSVYGVGTSIREAGPPALTGIFYILGMLPLAYLANVDLPYLNWAADASTLVVERIGNLAAILQAPHRYGGGYGLGLFGALVAELFMALAACRT